MPGVSQGSWLAGPSRAVRKACGSNRPSLPGQAHPIRGDDFSPDSACTKVKKQIRAEAIAGRLQEETQSRATF